jgi:hypothetical protein
LPIGKVQALVEELMKEERLLVTDAFPRRLHQRAHEQSRGRVVAAAVIVAVMPEIVGWRIEETVNGNLGHCVKVSV